MAGRWTFSVTLTGDGPFFSEQLAEALTYGLIRWAGLHRDTELLGAVDLLEVEVVDWPPLPAGVTAPKDETDDEALAADAAALTRVDMRAAV